MIFTDYCYTNFNKLPQPNFSEYDPISLPVKIRMTQKRDSNVRIAVGTTTHNLQRNVNQLKSALAHLTVRIQRHKQIYGNIGNLFQPKETIIYLIRNLRQYIKHKLLSPRKLRGIHTFSTQNSRNYSLVSKSPAPRDISLPIPYRTENNHNFAHKNPKQ